MKLGELCDVVRGSSPRPQGDPLYYGGSVPRLMVSDLTRDGMYVTPQIDFLTDAGAKLSRPMKRGDVVIAVSGNPGLPAILNLDACIHDGFVGFRNLDTKRISNVFLYHFLKANKDKTNSKAVGAIFKNLTTDQLKEIEVPTPDLQTQQKIASILAQADAARQKRKQSNQLTEQFLQSAFLVMFGDPVRNEKGWEVKELRDVVRKDDKVNYGVVQPGDDVRNGIPLIRVGDFIGMEISKENMKRISPDIESQYKRSRIIGDEILLACVGSIGKIALADESLNGFNTVRAVARIRCSALVNRLYLAYYLSTSFIQNYFINQTRTVSQPTLNIKQIEETRIILPPLPLQQKFAALVEQVERLRTKQRESEQELDNLFQSLMQKYFG